MSSRGSSTGIAGERAFKLATLSALAILTLFFVGIFVSLAAYTDWTTFFSILASKEILGAIRLTLGTATMAAAISMILAIPAAYALSQTKFPGKDVVDTILDLPIVVSPIALGAALLVFFNTPVGLGIENNLIKFVFEVPGIILAQFTVINALAVRLLKATFDGINPRYERVGRTLGYTKLAVFFRITLPLSRNGLLASAVLTWARAIGEFGATMTLAGAMKTKTETLPVAIFLNLATADVEKAVAVVFVLIVIAAGALMVLRKMTVKREVV
ncbi:MAG: Sulfate transport system permease protein CysW [Syntrophorhabdus sp. PtaU1.Bin153]|nr:MAG: Sulfate transport system permease protein CysW [Syntrophorhabdus sp. PtaU1.Bin153]